MVTNMDELIVKDSNLPSTIADLSKFILIGREKLISIKAEIKAINRLSLAQEVRDQKKEARENDKSPTFSRVVDLARSRKQGNSQEILKIKYQDIQYSNLNKLVRIIFEFKTLRAEKKYTQEWINA